MPRLLTYRSEIADWATRQASGEVVSVTFSLYGQQHGGSPVWSEIQNVRPDSAGDYSVVLGSLHSSGVPLELFTLGGANWLGVSLNGEPERERALLVSVPYAFKAHDADTLGGHAASEFMLANQVAGPAGGQAPFPVTSANRVTANVVVSQTKTAAASASAIPAATFQDNNATQVLLIQQLGTGFAVNAASNGGATINASNTGTGDSALAINAATSGVNATAVRAQSIANTGSGIGVYGISFNNGTGVMGETTPSSGAAYGVHGKTYSTSGIGVLGSSQATSGYAIGVRGENQSPNGAAGVFDTAQGGAILSGLSEGLPMFRVDSGGNVSAVGQMSAASFAGSGASLTNVNAATLNGFPSAVFLRSSSGLFPNTSFQDSTTNQVLTVKQQGAGSSINAISNTGAAITATNSGAAAGGLGILSTTASLNGVGLRAQSSAASGSGIGVHGISFNNGTGVLGETTAATGAAYGVRGKTYSTSGVGAFGASLSTTGSTVGVRGENHSPTGTAGQFDTVPGGAILTGTTYGVPRFSVDSTGNVTATNFTGPGAGLTNVNAATLGGYPPSAFMVGPGSDTVTNSVTVGAAGGPNGQVAIVQDNLDTVHSITKQSGTNYHFRLSRGFADDQGNKPDFLIAPYNYGMAIEYPGVLEMWVNDLSVHRNPGSKLSSTAQFWVGDEIDSGGLYVTAHHAYPTANGSVVLAADQFNHISHGSLYLTTRNATDAIVFSNGAWEQDTPIAQVRRQLDATNNLTSMEAVNATVDGGVVADAANNNVRIGSRSAHPVQFVTGDTQANVTMFPSGNVSVGNSNDSATLSVGSAGQFQVNSAGAVIIGGGTAITKHISTTGAVNFGTVAHNACASQSVAATGASDGDTVAMGVPNSLGSIDGLTWFAWVSATDTVSVRACNVTGQDIQISSDMVRLDVWKH